MDSKTKAELDKLEKNFKKQLIALALVAGYDWAIRTLTKERTGVITEMTRALSPPKVSHKALPKPKAIHRALPRPKPKALPKPKAVHKALPKPKAVHKALPKPKVADPRALPNLYTALALPKTRPELAPPKAPTFSPFAMRSALKNILAHGPQPIRKIAEELKDKGVTKDTSPETKHAIRAYLGRDKTFLIKKRGIYRLRAKT